MRNQLDQCLAIYLPTLAIGNLYRLFSLGIYPGRQEDRRRVLFLPRIINAVRQFPSPMAEHVLDV